MAIRDLIDEINACEGLVTTSSCAGRISVFLEGKRKDEAEGDENDGVEAEGEDAGERATTAGVGGKGGGGRWLFVSHDPVSVELQDGNPERSWAEVLGMKRCAAETDLASGIKRDTRYVHFKFEPMVYLAPISYIIKQN